MSLALRIVILLHVAVITGGSSDSEIHQQVSDMLRDAASVTEDSDLVQRAVEMCNYKYCDHLYDCENQTSDLFCKLFCQALKGLELCRPKGPCSPSPCLNDGLCANDGPNNFSCFCSVKYYGPICQYVAPPEDVLIAKYLYRTSESKYQFKILDLDSGKTTPIAAGAPFHEMRIDWNINTLFFLKNRNIQTVLIQEDSVVETAATIIPEVDYAFANMALDFVDNQIYLLQYYEGREFVKSYRIYRVSYNGGDYTFLHAPKLDFGYNGQWHGCDDDGMEINPLTRRLYLVYNFCGPSDVRGISNITVVLTECVLEGEMECQVISGVQDFLLTAKYFDVIDNQLYLLGVADYLFGQTSRQLAVVSIDVSTRQVTMLYHLEDNMAELMTARLNFVFVAERACKSESCSVYRIPKSGGDVEKMEWEVHEYLLRLA